METTTNELIPYTHKQKEQKEGIEDAVRFANTMKNRRSVRDFSTAEIPNELLKNLLIAAVSAPSESNKQPWTFCVIKNQDLKRKIRLLAEEEEFIKATKDVNNESFTSPSTKHHIEEAPCVIAVFRKSYEVNEFGIKKDNYYVKESAGISIGILISAIQQAGLSCVVHAPSPINHIHKLLGRPENEKPYLMIALGYAKPEAKVPNISKKETDSLCAFYY